jgi:hypothetical protein
MGAIAGTRLLPDTAKSVVNRSGASLYADRLVGYGTPDGQEDAVDNLYTTNTAKVAGALQVALADDDHGTVYGPGSIVELESDGSGTIDYGVDVIAVQGASLAVGGRVKTLPGNTGAYVVVGKCRSKTQIAATAGAKLLVELCHPTRVYVA